MRGRRSAGSVLVSLAAAAAVVVVGCAAPAPTADNAVPPPASVDPTPVVWAVLGGDESLVVDPAAAATSWTQRVLGELPASAQLLALATEDATVADALRGQVASVEASPVVPTVATVWLGGADRDTSGASYRALLGELVDRLGDLGVARVVLIVRTDPGSAARAADARAVAADRSVEVVEVDAITGDPRDPAAQADIAAAVGPLVAP